MLRNLKISITIWTNYRIRANKRPFLIRPPLWQNSDKTPLFCSKSPLFGAFSGKNWENSNIPPLKNPQSFIERRPFNSADTVYNWWPKNERGCQVLREKQKQLQSAQKQWVWVTEKEKGMKWVRGCLRTFFPPFPHFLHYPVGKIHW